MKNKNIMMLIIILVVSCTGGEKLNKEVTINTTAGRYTVYIINSSIHTGLVIPIENESMIRIRALEYFKDFQFADIGWGEEYVYQHPEENYCFYAKAVLLPNSSVLRVEGYSSISGMISWSDFTIKLTLTNDQFLKLIDFISKSFRKDDSDSLLIASKKYSGDIIFFKSVYRYHMFNTCNTWVAKALESSGLDVSPFFVLTAGQLYKEIKDQGTVLKALK